MRQLLNSIRWSVAVWLAPDLDVARGKRRLEAVAREAGASKAQSLRIAGEFFRGLKND